MKRLALMTICLALACEPWPTVETVSVPRLYGPDVAVPVTELHRLSPLNWAMLLDFSEGEAYRRNLELFQQECKRRLGLEDEVVRLFAIKGKVERAKKR